MHIYPDFSILGGKTARVPISKPPTVTECLNYYPSQSP